MIGREILEGVGKKGAKGGLRCTLTWAKKSGVKADLKPGQIKHHLTPEFRGNEFYINWFDKSGINVDDYCVGVSKEFNDFIHFGDGTGGRGGRWNRAWREFIDEHRGGASKDEIEAFIQCTWDEMVEEFGGSPF
ncbi:DUF2380 domain-containing protein [bacterium]|nr:DUF2380 domain-containing protein [bacterium]